MTFFSVLETFLLGPLKLVFEIIFQAAYRFIHYPGVAIIALSLLMNILVLPLYKRADQMQEKARDTEASLKRGVTHIKKTFSGDEKMMMLQTYYRQNNYSPVNALRGSVSLLLEIPFFMAAYQFLSSLSALEGSSFGPISDLSKPDGLIVIGTLTINALPIIMTLINVVSSAIYLKGFPLKTKIQLYAMAAFFLVFLYNSPAGLVFYWTLNNVFSLFKNIFYKLKNPRLVLSVLCSSVGIVMFAFFPFVKHMKAPHLTWVLFAVGLVLQIPSLVYAIKRAAPPRKPKDVKYKPSRKLFFTAGLFLTLFIGVLIPSNYVAASPQEYVDISYFVNPLWYIVSSVCLAGGLFLLWLGVFYWLASDKGKVYFERFMWAFCGVAVVNYMFFGTQLGVLSNTLEYKNGLFFSIPEHILNVLVSAAVIVGLVIAVRKWQHLSRPILLVLTAAIVVMSGINLFTIQSSVSDIHVEETDTAPRFTLSKEGQNVVVILLDRAMGEYAPYIFKEKPELMQVFDGFTYYSNVISFGGHTNMAAPALMGGYEYTPVEMNKRDTESLKDKHNEALKVMPAIFDANGYRVTVCDAPYANYKWLPDMSIYDDYPDINTYVTKGYFSSAEMKSDAVKCNHRNFFCFSLMKSVPIGLQYLIYSNGSYNMSYTPAVPSSQVRHSISEAQGMSRTFMEPFEALRNLKTMTRISEGDENTFLFFYNDATHEPMLMQTPNYEPMPNVDNRAYDRANVDRFTANGITIKMDNEKKMIHYHANMASLIQVGKWLDYLKAMDVYDNTKIIITSDHGYYLYQTEELTIYDKGGLGKKKEDVGTYFPLLMIKDFGAEGFSVSDEFMTNADVPTIAFEGSVDSPVNPFTGKPINSDEKYAHDQFIMTSRDWSTDTNNGNTFSKSEWIAVTDNIWGQDDWIFVKKSVLKEHAAP